MTTEQFFVAGDWGTSNLRLYLCRVAGSQPVTVVSSAAGPGIGSHDGDFEATFFELTRDWFSRHGALPTILSGMVGSTIGWREAPYVTCPAGASEIATEHIRIEARGLPIVIVAGLRCVNPFGTPDVMRGEELQLLGWMGLDVRDGLQLVALPGTHNKWVALQDARVETFFTSLSGELFALLKSHSVLLSDAEQAFSEAAFRDALATSRSASLLHALFSTRSRQVLGELAPEEASSYLSGLLIGADVGAATDLFRSRYESVEHMHLIGDERLCDEYRAALEDYGWTCTVHDPTRTALAGYAAVHRQLQLGERA